MLISRREWLEIGASSLLGLTWADRLRADQTRAASARARSARASVLIFLWGGPGQQDLWDLKPDAPAEVRGEFRPIATSVRGLQIGELLPSLARQAHHFTLVRSVTHKDFEHGSAAYLALTGQLHPAPGTNTPARSEDFPTYGAVVRKLRPAARDLPGAVALGPVMHQGARPPVAGQNAGFLGRGYDPFRIAQDPSEADFAVEALSPQSDIAGQRLEQRQRLLDRFESGRQRDVVLAGMDSHFQQAFDLLRSSRVQRAFDLSLEPGRLRDQYGWSRFGQTLLLTRRLVEAGVPFVTINWDRQNGDQWDTHRRNYGRLRELLPPFDQGLAAFLADLSDRGLLDSTLVYCLGEFGRTPLINATAGRDHWPDCYSVLLAGGGVRCGQVIGASDRRAAYPATQPLSPWDLGATVYHCLGIDPASHLHDPQGRLWPLSYGEIARVLL